MILPFFVDPSDPPAKQQILVEALRLFVRNGLNATSIRDIAEATGYTNPALYRHFESKEALAAYLFEACYLHIYERLADALSSRGDFTEQLTAYIDRAVDLYYECPEALLYVNDHVRELWPRLAPRLAPRSHVGQARDFAAHSPAARRDRISEQMLAAALLGTFGMWARLTYFGDGWASPAAAKEALLAISRRLLE